MCRIVWFKLFRSESNAQQLTEKSPTQLNSEASKGGSIVQ